MRRCQREARVRAGRALAGIGLVAGLACQSGGEAVLPQTVDSAGIRITTIGAAPADVVEWRLVVQPELVVTGAEAGDSAAFAQVGTVRWLESGRFVVGDVMANRLYVFDSAGQFLRAFGREGNGPGEFRQLGSMTALAADSVATYDPSLLRLSVWHPDTGFVRSTHLRGEESPESWLVDAWPWRDSASVALQMSLAPQDAAAGGGQRRWQTRARLTLRDAAGEVVKTSPLFDGTYTVLHAGGDAHAPFSHRGFVAVASDRVYYGSGASYAISYIDTSFDQAGELRWPGQREALTTAEVEQVMERVYAGLPAGYPMDRRRARVEPGFAPATLPRNRPAIGRVLVASDGRLWVERFVATHPSSPLPAASDEWTVLEADGRPVARLRIPPGVRLEDVRGSKVAVVGRDSVDVQHVGVYQLARP